MSILVDYRKGGGQDNAPEQLKNELNRLGVKAEIADLLFGDVAFDGKGPDGNLGIGIERKTLHDLLNCIDDGTLSGHQLPGMKNMYGVRFLLVEGHYKPHDPNGYLMEGFSGGISWGYCKYRSMKTPYSKVSNFLLSVSLTGVIVVHSRDLWHTAFLCKEMFHYFQKKWDDHTSMRETRKINIPTFMGKPPLVRLWAQDLEGIGVKHGEMAARMFRKPITLANADESEWLKIPGVGVRTAQQIVREIWGNR